MREIFFRGGGWLEKNLILLLWAAGKQEGKSGQLEDVAVTSNAVCASQRKRSCIRCTSLPHCQSFPARSL